MPGLTTSEVARQGGVNLESIRFYERERLLPKVPRTASGYRMFTPDDVRRVRFIKRAQELGFSLKEIKELLSLRDHPNTACQEVRSQAEAKIADVSEKIRHLRAIKRELTRLADACAGAHRPHSCPILTRLEGVNGKSATKGTTR
jgi:MerR family mercuric resistance operon transcriptional regulator